MKIKNENMTQKNWKQRNYENDMEIQRKNINI